MTSLIEHACGCAIRVERDNSGNPVALDELLCARHATETIAIFDSEWASPAASTNADRFKGARIVRLR